MIRTHAKAGRRPGVDRRHHPSMAGARLTLRLVILGAAVAFSAFLHHGHIAMFLTDVRTRLARKGSTRLPGSKVVQESSRLQVHFGDPSVHYQVAVHRKSRSLEVGLHFEGERAENERWLRLLSDRSDEIRRKLGPSVEFEQWTRKWTRLHETRVLSGDDWSPKRDLTPRLAEETATRVMRFVRVLQPLIEREGARAPQHVASRPRGRGSASR